MSQNPTGQPQQPEFQPGQQPPPWQPPALQPPAGVQPDPQTWSWGPSAAYQTAPDYGVPAGQYQTPGLPDQPPGSGYQTPASGYPNPGNGYQAPGSGYQAPYGLAVPMANPYALSAQAPYGIDPVSGLPYSDKSKLVAGLLQVFLGSFGVGRFYLGDIGIGVAQLIVTIVTFGIGALWPLIDGIVILAGSPRDKQGRPVRS